MNNEHIFGQPSATKARKKNESKYIYDLGYAAAKMKTKEEDLQRQAMLNTEQMMLNMQAKKELFDIIAQIDLLMQLQENQMAAQQPPLPAAPPPQGEMAMDPYGPPPGIEGGMGMMGGMGGGMPPPQGIAPPDQPMPPPMEEEMPPDYYGPEAYPPPPPAYM